MPQSSHIEATLNFLRPVAGRPARYVTDPPPGVPRTNIESEPHRVTIENGRLREHSFTLDAHGFALLRAPTRFADFYDEDAIRDRYLPEVEAVLKQALVASRVVAFDHNVRNARRAAINAALREPAKRVHNDYTYRSAPQRVRDVLPEEAERLLTRRFAIVNLWRPIAPVLESPLALAEGLSIAERDLVASDLIYADRIGETFSVTWNPAHRWVYFPHQQPEEALLIKCYDSAIDGRARLSAHGAFDDPTSPPDAPPRESIEVRTLVFWDAEHPADA
ncbi:CmcJ/NvfI family oxidoreductase [Plastoroseomonas hellenica]|uniref:CmcJ/NvfI family oxidoreductase n=1 Tax=Plastoroseomonas hellenica TaxID=2687306 RepID=UPI001BACD781|nr:CmcJ/NvfI family oxidoreductase [Plastoroseomonas hellenica]MBR0646017.1 methyltransferase [Plastoroseomonas hellenica]